MKKLKFLCLAPCFLAAICDPADDPCGLSEPENYVITVENISKFYAVNETIWLNSEVSSKLFNSCDESENEEIIYDSAVFLDGIFVLKLNNQSEFNAIIVPELTVNYDVGTNFSNDRCIEAINYLPILSSDNSFYNYRVGVSINAPGDYCIVSARSSLFNSDDENNAEIFEAYNTLDNKIKFNSCETILTRNGTEGHYFFTIQ